MPLLDLSLATQTLKNLLERRVKAGLTALGQPAVAAGLTVSALPADKLSGDQTIGLYLYHVTEEAQFKNLPPPCSDQPPVRFSPMGLNLYYQLTTQSELLGEQSAPRMQTLFGLALKAMHDYPSIDSTTVVDGTPLFPIGLQDTDNCLRITLQSLPPGEAPQYWTGGSLPVRLAAYYIVSVVLIEPESPTQFAGRVLRYGVHTFLRGAPRLDASRSPVTFRVPGESADRTIQVQPAEAPVGGIIRFHGTELAGDDTVLVLKNPRFASPVEVGPTWGIVATADRITATAAPQIGPFDTLPGLYSAIAKVTTRLRLPDGSSRDFDRTSNEVPFLITPDVTNPPANTVAVANAQGVVIITGGVFTHADIPPEAVTVMVGSQAVPREPTAALTPGHFRVSSATQLRFRFPIGGLVAGQTVPFRIMINGAENAPRWVTVP
jgi:hypothetical protein